MEVEVAVLLLNHENILKTLYDTQSLKFIEHLFTSFIQVNKILKVMFWE